MSGDHESIQNQIIAEDNRLKNYTKWQETWSKVQHNIAEKLNLEEGNLLMNYADDFQQVNQEKEILDCAKTLRTFDKYRGNPDFYNVGLALRKRFECPKARKCCCCKIIRWGVEYPCDTEPTYYLTKTKKQQNVLPIFDIVGKPQETVWTETRSIYKKWQNNNYRHKQFRKFEAKIKQIVPHWPKFEHLIVIGNKMELQNPQKSDTTLPSEAESEIEVTLPEKSVSLPKLEGKKPKLGLQINQLFLDTKTEKKGTQKILLFFEYDLCSKQPQVKFLKFENTNTKTLRISWRKLEQFRLFGDFAQVKLEKNGFYFNKQELMVLPGRSLKLPIWFKTEQMGVLVEEYEILATPAMWDEDFQVILKLQSYAFYGSFQLRFDEIQTHLEIQAKNILIKDILIDVMEKIKYQEKPLTDCVYGEAQLFQFANLYEDRPVVLYQEDSFKELSHFHERIKANDLHWNYSLESLRKLAQKKDVYLYSLNKIREVEEKIQHVENATKLKETKTTEPSGKKLKKGKKPPKSPKGSKKSKKSKKTKTVSKLEAKTEIELIVEPFEYANQFEFASLTKQLDFPVVVNANREKYFACYQILSGYFAKMCQQLYALEAENSVIRKSSYPVCRNDLLSLNEQPERLVYEYFEHHYIPKMEPDEFYEFEARRKPKHLCNLGDNVEMLYSIYFNKPLSSKKESKKKRPKQEKKKKEKKSKKGSKKSKDSVRKEESILSFNPFSENFVYVPEVEEVEVSGNEDILNIPKLRLEDHKYKEYLIVYSCLSQAVDAVFDTLESFDCIASYSTLDAVKSQLQDFNKK